MSNIIEDYNELLDNGKSITELYIYHLIISDEQSFSLSDMDILKMIQKVLELKSKYYNLSIETLVEVVLNREEIDEDDDKWDLY